MGIIKWWNDRKSKSAEVVQEPQEYPKCPDCGANAGHFSTCTGSTVKQPDTTLSDDTRVKNYVDGGGEIVDMSNKPRKEGDGFPPDQELLTPFNRAHEGTKAGLAGMVGRKR